MLTTSVKVWAVVGGRGTIGRSLVAQLLSCGQIVRVVGHDKDAREFLGCEYRFANLCDRIRLAEAVQGADIVVQSTTWLGNSVASLERDLVSGTQALVAVCCACKIPKFIHLSTICALDLSTGETIRSGELRDTHPKRRNYYARFKNQAEQIVLEAATSAGLDAAILRPGIVLGPGIKVQHSGIGHWISSTRCKTFGPGDTDLPFVLCEDVADAIIKVGMHATLPSRCYNLVGDIRFSARRYLFLAGQQSYRRFHAVTRPYLFNLGEAWIRWMLKAIVRSAPGRYPSLRDIQSMACRSGIDCTAAKHDFGWKPNDDWRYFYRHVFEANLPFPSPGDFRL